MARPAGAGDRARPDLPGRTGRRTHRSSPDVLTGRHRLLPSCPPGGDVLPHKLTPELRAWLTARPPRYPVLATIRPDGSPRLSVIWALLRDDDRVLMNTRFDRAKAQDLARDPRASLCFEDGYQYVTLEGTVEMQPDPDLADIGLLREHYGDDKDFSAQRGQRVSVLLTVERVLVHLRRL